MILPRATSSTPTRQAQRISVVPRKVTLTRTGKVTAANTAGPLRMRSIVAALRMSDMAVRSEPPPRVLVVASPRMNGSGAEVLFTADYDEIGFSQILIAKRHHLGAFAAVMQSDGRFAVLPNGLIFDPTLRRPGVGRSDVERVAAAKAMSDQLFRAMDGLTPSELKRMFGTCTFDAQRLRRLQAASAVCFALAAVAIVVTYVP